MSHSFDGFLAPGLSPERHVHLLRRESKIAVRADGLFGHAFEEVVKDALKIAPAEMTAEEAAAAGIARSPDDIALDLGGGRRAGEDDE